MSDDGIMTCGVNSWVGVTRELEENMHNLDYDLDGAISVMISMPDGVYQGSATF